MMTIPDSRPTSNGGLALSYWPHPTVTRRAGRMKAPDGFNDVPLRQRRDAREKVHRCSNRLHTNPHESVWAAVQAHPTKEDDMADAASTQLGSRLIGLVAAFLLTLALPGCSVFNACPAIAWNNTVIVKLEGETRDVSVVELCADGVCSVPAPV